MKRYRHHIRLLFFASVLSTTSRTISLSMYYPAYCSDRIGHVSETYSNRSSSFFILTENNNLFRFILRGGQGLQQISALSTNKTLTSEYQAAALKDSSVHDSNSSVQDGELLSQKESKASLEFLASGFFFVMSSLSNNSNLFSLSSTLAFAVAVLWLV
jgi:hypothetical protein